MQSTFQLPRLTNVQEKEGHWVESCEDRVLVWHKKPDSTPLQISRHRAQGSRSSGEREKATRGSEATNWLEAKPERQ